jgi:hypothetical protein
VRLPARDVLLPASRYCRSNFVGCWIGRLSGPSPSRRGPHRVLLTDQRRSSQRRTTSGPHEEKATFCHRKLRAKRTCWLASNPAFARKVVTYTTRVPPGTIVTDPGSHFLYSVQDGKHAIRYGVGVGGEGFGWSGSATVHSKQEWPDWYPPAEMLQRKPELREHMTQLQSGIGMQGGPENPIGARELYLWQGNKDTLYRIHGTNEPWTIGQNVSSGCIRLTNDDVTDLYNRTPVGTKVLVLATAYTALWFLIGRRHMDAATRSWRVWIQLLLVPPAFSTKRPLVSPRNVGSFI